MLSQTHGRRIIFVVLVMCFIQGLAIDIYVPSLPTIKTLLKTTEQLVQLTMTAYLTGYVMGGILFGPLTDAKGRKKPLIIGVSLFIVFSYLCTLATRIETLLLYRFFQGVSISVLAISRRVVLTDTFVEKKLITAMTYASLSYYLSPILAPLIGGYLVVFFGWHSNFYFLSLFGLLLILFSQFLLPETHHERESFHPKKVIEKYLSVMRIIPFLGGSFSQGILYSLLIVFNIVGPFFLENIIGLTPIHYGHIALLLGIGCFIGLLTSRFLIHFFSPNSIVTNGMWLLLVSSILQVILALIFPTNLYSFVIPIGLNFLLICIINTVFLPQSFQLIKHGKGTASAVQSLIIITTTTLVTFLASFLRSTTIVPTALCYFSLTLLAICSYHFLYRKKLVQ